MNNYLKLCTQKKIIRKMRIKKMIVIKCLITEVKCQRKQNY